MTRQADIKQEEQDTKKRDALYRTLEYSLPGALQHQGIELRGFSIIYDAFSCCMVLKGTRHNKWIVAFIYSDTMTNCLLRADSDASRGTLKWGTDKYAPDDA